VGRRPAPWLATGAARGILAMGIMIFDPIEQAFKLSSSILSKVFYNIFSH